jgi:hypothetical protein
MKAWAAAALLALPAAAQGQVPQASPAERAAAEQRLAGWTRPALAPFGGEREVRRYFADAQEAGYAQPRPDEQFVMIIEDRMGPRGAPGPHRRYPEVDDGDVIVRVGRFLVVVDHSSVFSIDTGADGRAPRLAGQLDLYSGALGTFFFDEAMVAGDRVVLSGFSRATRAVEIVVLRLAADGALRREDDFLISTQDDFQTSIVGDRLVVYTSTVGPIDYSPPDFPWPVIRRGRERSALPARTIYRPLVASLRPELHIVTICPLGEEEGQSACRSTAFAGPSGAAVHVSPDGVFVAVRPHHDDPGLSPAPRPDCVDAVPVPGDVGRTIIYRVPLTGGPPSALFVRGALADGGGLQARGGALRALLGWTSERCNGADALVYLRAPLDAFGAAPAEPAASAYAPVPETYPSDLFYRFTPRHLAYGPHASWLDPKLVVLPLERPQAAREVDLPRSVDRLDPSGAALLFAGGDREGAGREGWVRNLSLSRLDPDSGHIAADTLFDGAGEARPAGWSAARIEADGSGLVGVPVLVRAGEAAPWLETRFFTLAPDGRMAGAGALASRILPAHGCEGSCTNWFEASRPIFIGERIFAYTGVDLIEARLEGGRVREIGRLDIVRALRGPARPAPSP